MAKVSSSPVGPVPAILMNICVSVSIVFINKWISNVHGFHFGAFLTLVHFIVTSLGLTVAAKLGMFEVKDTSTKSILPLCFTFCGFVVLNNLSLQYNPVKFYQIMKILTTPVVVIMERILYHKRLSERVQLSLVPVCAGVFICTYTEVSTTFLGVAVSLSSVVVTGLYQIFAGVKQEELAMSSTQLLYHQVRLSSLMLMVCVPMIEDVSQIAAFEYSFELIVAILLSAALALLVNLSIFLVIRATSAVTYNVVGHLKTVMIISGGFMWFGDTFELKNFIGVCLTMTGIVWYTKLKLEAQKVSHAKAEGDESSEGRDRSSSRA